MGITKVKYWNKTVKQSSIDHVKISYNENENETTLHSHHDNSTASPEFYAAFENFSPIICKTCGIDESLASALSLREISIAQSEDKNGDDNSKYTLVYGLKSGHANTTIKTTINHKYIPEGFENAVQEIIDEAEEYINGERAQTELDLDTEPETKEELE